MTHRISSVTGSGYKPSTRQARGESNKHSSSTPITRYNGQPHQYEDILERLRVRKVRMSSRGCAGEKHPALDHTFIRFVVGMLRVAVVGFFEDWSANGDNRE